ncbi:hypothetical protein [Kitasatospora sp. NPDC090308]|uniref:hypothetical protein n=1 Tax=Kitasatospora sp. NPDC090308 TaxID=3364082 RepID=UPI0038049475
MDVVYASLHRKDTAGRPRDGEAEEIQAVLWAHARPTDAVQHITVRCESERVDLLLYLLTRPTTDAAPATGHPAAPAEATAKDSLAVAHSLITRSHRASPMLQRRYQPPTPPTAC